jgi:hypothetical protein
MVAGAEFQGHGRKSPNDRRRIPLKNSAESSDDRCFNRVRLVAQERAKSNSGIDALLFIA